MKERKHKQIQKERSFEQKNIFSKKSDDRTQRGQNYTFINRKKMYQQIKQIDRSEQCPFLVRLFYAVNDQNKYKPADPLPQVRQFKFHLWMNTTLKEITELLRATFPSIRAKQKFFYWKLVYCKQKKQYEKVELGWVYTSKRYDKVQQKALCHTKFNIGDMIDVSITYK